MPDSNVTIANNQISHADGSNSTTIASNTTIYSDNFSGVSLGNNLLTYSNDESHTNLALMQVVWTEATVLFEEEDLSLDVNIVATNKPLAITGSIANQNIEGWRYDQRRLRHDNINSTKYNTFIGGHNWTIKDGTKLLDWQSGVIEGLDLIKIKEGHIWNPIYEIGKYSINHDVKNLFSEYSTVQRVDINDNENDRYVATVRDDCLHSSLDIRLFKRDSFGRTYTFIKWKQEQEFLGVPNGVDRDDPGVWPTINWANVNERENHYIVRDNEIRFSNSTHVEIGIGNTYFQVINTWEKVGRTVDTGSIHFLEYYPIQEDSIEVSVIDGASKIDYTIVDDFAESTPTDLHCVVDYDLGIVTTGGFKANDLILREDITDSSDSIPFFETLDYWPPMGVVTIGTEKILYRKRSKNTLYDLTRGYDATTASAHLKGASIEHQRQGQALTGKVYCKYIAVPRIEYEVTETNWRAARRNPLLNIRPGVNGDDPKIIQINSKISNVAKIILETDKAPLGGGLFGPMRFGTDSSLLTATVLDSFDIPVPEILTTIEIISGPGLLNGIGPSHTEFSNQNGQINAIYTSPYDQDDVTYRVLNTRHDGLDTYMEVSDIVAGTIPSEVWVFQVLKHDPIFGSVGDKKQAFNGGATTPPWGESFIDIRMVNTHEYTNGGILFLINPSTSARQPFKIVHNLPIEDPDGYQACRIYVEGIIDPAWFGSGDIDVWLLQKEQPWIEEFEGKEWIPSLFNGVRVILYEWSTNAEHPITGLTGAYLPLRPDAIVGNEFRFDNRHLAIPDPIDDNTNLGAYIIVAPKEVRFQANATDPFTGRNITSNIVRMKMLLPNALVGVDETGALPIPYGWRTYLDSHNVGTGLGLANFITVNPSTDGINQFTLTGVI